MKYIDLSNTKLFNNIKIIKNLLKISKLFTLYFGSFVYIRIYYTQRREKLVLLSLLGTSDAAVDLGVEGDGVTALAAFLGDDAALNLTLSDELQAFERLAGPVEGTGGSLDGEFGEATSVLLAAEGLGETTVTVTGAEVDVAEDGGTAVEVPVVVLGSAFATVRGLEEVSAGGDHELTFTLELLGHSLNPLVGSDVTDGGTLSLADVAELTLLGRSSDHF